MSKEWSERSKSYKIKYFQALGELFKGIKREPPDMATIPRAKTQDVVEEKEINSSD